jgi:hypothetical protein
MNVTPCMQVQFQQHHEARTEHPLPDCIHKHFFQPIASRLQAGDRITLCQFEDPTWSKLVALIHLRVIRVEGGAVYLKSEGPMTVMDIDVPEVIAGDPVTVKLKRVSGGRYQVLGLDEFDILPEFESKEAAEEWIRRNHATVRLATTPGPKPKEKEPA